MKEISLTQGQFTIVDDWWYDYLMQWRWSATWNRCTNSFYAVRREGKQPRQKAILMHRVIMNTPIGMQCDHIYHKTLDNRESELRNVTRSQNLMNKSLHSNNVLGVRGVAKTANGKYTARLMCDGVNVLNKTFPGLDDAIKARLEAEKKYFGDFAYSNVQSGQLP